MKLSQLITYINITYLILVFTLDLFFPHLNFVSLSNLLLPLVLIGGISLFKNHKNIVYITGIIFLVILYELIVNTFITPLKSSEISYILRPLKILVIIYAVAQLNKNEAMIISFLIRFSFIGVVLISACQLMNLDFFINAFTSQKAVSDYTTFSLIDSRIPGVFLNPNNLGFYMSVYALFFYFSNHTYKWHFFLLACLLFVFSQSRTVLIAAIIIAGIEFLRVVIFSKNRKINYWLVTGLVALVIAISFSLPNTRSLICGTAFQSSSFQKRIQIFKNVGEVNHDSFLLGKGHLNNIPNLIGGYIDSEYAYLFLEYGIIGLLLVVGAFTLILLNLWKKRSSYFYLYSFLLFMVIGFTNLSFSNYEILPYFIALGVFSIHETPKLEEKQQ